MATAARRLFDRDWRIAIAVGRGLGMVGSREFLERHPAVAILVHPLEILLRHGAILLADRAGQEFLAAQCAIVVRIEFLENLALKLPATGTIAENSA